MINNLNANLPGSKFIYIDIARMFEDLLVNYRSYGMHTLLLYLIFYHSIKLCIPILNIQNYFFSFSLYYLQLCKIVIQIYVFFTTLNCFMHTGFSVIDRGCCGIGRNRGQITCLPFQTPCPNRDQYVFWDAFHPTEAVNILFGKKAFSGDLSIVYPMNIQQLANLDIGPN